MGPGPGLGTRAGAGARAGAAARAGAGDKAETVAGARANQTFRGKQC